MPDLTRNERRDARLRQLLVERDRHAEGLTWARLWPLLTAAVPLTDEDRETTTTGAPKSKTDVRWQLTNFDKAGWVLTGQAILRLTREGRAALQRFTDASALQAAAASAPASNTGPSATARALGRRPRHRDQA